MLCKGTEEARTYRGLEGPHGLVSVLFHLHCNRCKEASWELLVYHATVLIEALRFGCRGWLSYDKMFREHIKKEPQSS